ncbi:putative TolB domain-containing protein [Magnetofaba australis IT-1]|uniref:Tol-Pal system protein TolB n=1 Tax=Magnetofaba australis IT-1 TaxID=1434232 RepID=A0A1Y2K124_9PROT|nr:putative TolB domain-containing protein [Magnetofaba australis IT-1]
MFKKGLTAMPIALPAFVSQNAQGKSGAPDALSQRITEVVSADLGNSGFFKIQNPDTYLQGSLDLWNRGPNYREWRLVGADAVVGGSALRDGDKLRVDFYLYDVAQGKLIGKGWRFSATINDWRHVAHRVSDEIYKRLTGQEGYFTSRIAFVAGEGRRKWLAMMDADGANRIDLDLGVKDQLVLSPRFSPDGERLFYISYESGEPRIYRWELYTGKRVRLTAFPGLNSTPSWSPDGTKMALTLSKDGNPEIYVQNLTTGQLKRITRHPGIDTSPTWSPDGETLAFVSDRSGGKPQIYTVRARGGNPERLTFEGKRNLDPAWSPNGDRMAFVRNEGGKFRIGVMDADGKNVQLLTDSWMDEEPTWSPNGRVILFSRQERGSGEQHLYTIDVTGANERRVRLPDGVEASGASWSPLIR